MENRIRTIMELERMSQQEFAQKLGLSPATLSNIFKGKTRPTNNHVQAIHRAFPNINISWLLFGEGDMYVDGSGSKMEEGDTAHTADSMGRSAVANDSCTEINPEGTEVTHLSNAGNLFSSIQGENSLGASTESVVSKNRNPAQISEINLSSNNVKIIDNRPRRIKEIRVFYDDGTYESFVPSR